MTPQEQDVEARRVSDLDRQIMDDPRHPASAALRRAVEAETLLSQREEELVEARTVLDRVIEAGVERWHTVVNDEPSLLDWLGLTREEYAAYVEQRPPFAALSRSNEGPQ